LANANRITVSGSLIELDVLRHTPAGVPMLKFRIRHESSQTEADGPRKVNCEMSAVAFDREAKLLAAAKLGSNMTITGFLAAKSRTGRALVLHATKIDFEQGE
jgi:primosomal replication protein N